jgi:TPP-dependent trihydroxycyclohexane-1,2-dione (THcHDO) dehydratase
MNMELNLIESPELQMETVHALVFGKHDYIVNNVKAQLEKAEFKCSGSVVLSQALEYLKASQPQLIVIGGGVNPHDRIKIQNSIKDWSLSTRIVEHFGGPATVLNEVREALSTF